jgi:hypothetical protein
VSILLVQLGDIHFKKHDDPAHLRSTHIGAAVSAEISHNTTTIVLAMCGDISYSGQIDQFNVAKLFIETIEFEIKKRRSDLPIVRIAVPGNHDCDFSSDQAARNVVLTSIKESERPAQSICDIALAPLKEYFKFSSSFVGTENSISDSHCFYNVTDIVDNDKILRLHLLNTAWMSSLREQPGSLHFPLVEINPPSTKADCAIAILHHPTNWFSQPHAMRPLRDKLARVASIVLVNHEHVPEATEYKLLYNRDGGAIKTIYISGGVIQENGNPEICNFNMLNIDTAASTLLLSRHEFRNSQPMQYFERTGKESIGLSPSELSIGPAGASLTEHLISHLDDPGAPISHPNRDPRIPVRLRDIFLYPDLWELDADHDGSDQKQIKSSNVAREVLGTKKVLITGGEKSGRTAIAKSLFMSAFELGKVPLLLSGGDFPKNPNKLRDMIRKSVEEHYKNLTADAFEQFEPNSRVIIVDDVHYLPPAANIRNELIKLLEMQFGTVVLCGDDLFKMDELNGINTRDSGLWDYRHLIILGFGEYLREQFVRQWLMLAGDTVADDAIIEAEIERICSLLNVIIKKQLLPAYPLFLLVVLQQSDLANTSVQTGSFGKLFEGLVTAILNKSSFRRITIGDKYHYLAAMANKMYEQKTMYLPVATARQWHKDYWNVIELDIDYDRLINDFYDLGVLNISNEGLRFKYAYYYCFFMAYFLNRSLHEATTRTIISILSKQLHHRVSAETILFLAHLTGDPIVLSEMIITCDSLFSDTTPATLDTDVESLNRLGDAVGTIAIPDAPNDNRKELKLRKDALVKERLIATKSTQELVPPEADNESIKRLFDMHAAFKTIQILGQAIRNIAGSASKERKEYIIGKIIGLSRRLLSIYLELFNRDNLPSIIEDIAAVHKEQQPDLVATKIHDEVCRHLYGLSQFVCFSVIKHTTFSVGSENLAPTVHRVLSESSTPLTRILDLSFDLETPKKFPKDAALELYKSLSKNHFSASVVRILVAHHLYLYIVPIQDRQTVCNKLDIKLLPAIMDRTRKNLTS